MIYINIKLILEYILVLFVMNNKSITMFLMYVLVNSCNTSKNIDIGVNEIDVNISKINSYRNIKVKKITPLETSENSVIGRCEKIVEYQDKYYVLDFKERNVKIFDKSGNYFETIGRIGRGKNEYLHISDININKAKNSLDLLDPRGKIVRYDLSNSKYLEDIGVPTTASEISHFKWLNKDTIIFSSFFQDFNLRLFSVKADIIFDKMVRSSMVDTEVAPFFFKSPFWSYKNEINYLNLFDMKIIHFDGVHLAKRFLINLGSNHFSFDEIEGVQKEFDILEYLQKKDKAFPIYNCFENKDYFAFGIYINKQKAVKYYGFEKSNPEELFIINVGEYEDNGMDYEAFATGLESENFNALVQSPGEIRRIFKDAEIPGHLEVIIEKASSVENPYLIEYELVDGG